MPLISSTTHSTPTVILFISSLHSNKYLVHQLSSSIFFVWHRPHTPADHRARFKHTARKTIRTRGTVDASSRNPPPKFIKHSSGAPPRKNQSRDSNGGGDGDGDGEGRSTRSKNGNKKRFRPGALALKEIRRYQNSTDLLVPKGSFQRIVREVSRSLLANIRFQSTAVIALQFAVEAYAVRL